MIIGLYVVLWGKAKDLEEMKQGTDPKLPSQDQRKTIVVMVEESNTEEITRRTDLEEPLLPDKSKHSHAHA